MTEVAVGILRKSEKILICQRKKGDRYGLKWEFPGGKLEPGETSEECLRRELQEELSIEVNSFQKIHTEESFYTDGGWFRVSYFVVPIFSGELKNNIFEQIRWAPPAELENMDILEGNRSIIAKLNSQSKCK